MNVETRDVARSAAWIGLVEVQKVVQDDRKIPLLTVVARVVDVMKGESSPGESVSFKIPGGSVRGKSVGVMGFARFKVGSEYIVFLDSVPSPVTGLSLHGRITGLQSWTAYEVTKSRSGERRALRAGTLARAQQSQRGLSITHDVQDQRLSDLYSEIFRGID